MFWYKILNFWVHHRRPVSCKIIMETHSIYCPHFGHDCKGVVIWRISRMLGWRYVYLMYSDSLSFEFRTSRRIYSQSSECIQVPCISSVRVKWVLLLSMFVIALRYYCKVLYFKLLRTNLIGVEVILVKYPLELFDSPTLSDCDRDSLLRCWGPWWNLGCHRWSNCLLLIV